MFSHGVPWTLHGVNPHFLYFISSSPGWKSSPSPSPAQSLADQLLLPNQRIIGEQCLYNIEVGDSQNKDCNQICRQRNQHLNNNKDSLYTVHSSYKMVYCQVSR